MGEEKDNKFRFKYSAPTESERKEIESIARAYKKEEQAKKREKSKNKKRP